MSSEFNMYMQLHEMQPPPPMAPPMAPPPPPRMSHVPQMHMAHSQFPPADYVHHYNNFGAGVGMPISAYPMTAASPGGCSVPVPSTSSMSPMPSMPDMPDRELTRSRKRKPRPNVSKSDYGGGASDGLGMQRMVEPPPRKSRSSHGAANALEDEADDVHSIRTASDKKQNHSEIEKRRRDKMNTYITELGAMVPMCRALNRKLDKLTILRLAVQHMRTVRGAISAGPLTVRPLPTILTAAELNSLVVRAAADCFVVVVGCDRGRMMYVSDSVVQILNFHQTELLGQSFFDLLHPKDVAKVKEQMSSSESGPRERLIDAKTMLPVKADHVAGVTRLSPGSRRSFFCRLKCQANMGSTLVEPMKLEPDMPRKNFNKKYCLVQCTGYLKAWAPGELSDDCDSENDRDSGLVPCLVAIARVMPDTSRPAQSQGPAPYGPVATPTSVRPLQFASRHGIDGKFLFVDQRVTVVLGFLPHEMVGTSVYEFVDGDEHTASLADAHRETLYKKVPIETQPYEIRRKDGSHAVLITHFKYLNNPWTKEMECLVANNTLLSEQRQQEHDEEEEDENDQYPEFKDVLPRQRVGANSQMSAQAIVQTNFDSYAQTSANSEWSTQTCPNSEWNSRTCPKYEWDTQSSAISEWNRQASAHSELISLINVISKERSPTAQENARRSARTCTQTSAQMIPNINANASFEPVTEKRNKASTQTVDEMSTHSYSEVSAVLKEYAEANAYQSAETINAEVDGEANAKECAEESVDAIAEGSTDADADPGADATSALSHLTEAVGEEVQRMIVSRAASLKLGSAIAEEAQRRNSPALSPEPSVDLLHDAVFSQQPTLVDNLLNCDSPYPYIRNNVSLGEAGGNNTPPPESVQSERRYSGGSPPPTSPLLPIPIDGNGEAAMAVLMNLLEADAGLGGPVNMSTLPWLFP